MLINQDQSGMYDRFDSDGLVSGLAQDQPLRHANGNQRAQQPVRKGHEAETPSWISVAMTA